MPKYKHKSAKRVLRDSTPDEDLEDATSSTASNSHINNDDFDEAASDPRSSDSEIDEIFENCVEKHRREHAEDVELWDASDNETNQTSRGEETPVISMEKLALDNIMHPNIIIKERSRGRETTERSNEGSAPTEGTGEAREHIAGTNDRSITTNNGMVANQSRRSESVPEPSSRFKFKKVVNSQANSSVQKGREQEANIRKRKAHVQQEKTEDRDMTVVIDESDEHEEESEIDPNKPGPSHVNPKRSKMLRCLRMANKILIGDPQSRDSARPISPESQQNTLYEPGLRVDLNSRDAARSVSPESKRITYEPSKRHKVVVPKSWVLPHDMERVKFEEPRRLTGRDSRETTARSISSGPVLGRHHRPNKIRVSDTLNKLHVSKANNDAAEAAAEVSKMPRNKTCDTAYHAAKACYFKSGEVSEPPTRDKEDAPLQSSNSEAAQDNPGNDVSNENTVSEDEANVVARLREELAASRAETTTEKNKYTELVAKLQSKVECPVCLEVPKTAPIRICPNGHVICTTCVRLTCPTCRVRMGEGTSTIAVTIIENIPHTCEFQINGCQMICLLPDLQRHLKSCPFRTVKCPSFSCAMRVPLSELAEHTLARCIHTGTYKSSPLVTSYNYVIAENHQDGMFDFRRNSTWRPDGITFDEKSFFLKIIRKARKSMWYYFIQMAGTEEDCDEYVATLHVFKPAKKVGGMFSNRFVTGVCPIDISSTEQAAARGFCSLLPDNVMKQILTEVTPQANGNKKYEFNVSVHLQLKKDFEKDMEMEDQPESSGIIINEMPDVTDIDNMEDLKQRMKEMEAAIERANPLLPEESRIAIAPRAGASFNADRNALVSGAHTISSSTTDPASASNEEEGRSALATPRDGLPLLNPADQSIEDILSGFEEEEPVLDDDVDIAE